MAEDAKKQDQLIETTDCLEAIGTLKTNKNLFFFIILLCLLILQGIFWLVPTKYVEMPGKEIVQQAALPVAVIPQLAATAEKEKEKAIKIEKKNEKIEKTAQELAADANNEPNEPNAPSPAKAIIIPPFKIKFSQLSWVIKPCNFLLIVCSCLYSLSLLFAMKVSLVGRLGGIRHITKAVFVSFWIIVLILPWQLLFKDVICGAIYTQTELLGAWQSFDKANVTATVIMFLRFTVLWLVVVLLLFWAQIKSMQWSKNTLKRLGIIG
ncbi:MAG: hypothetical protein ABSE89_06580 [Sedimentisphaerales bacterium]